MTKMWTVPGIVRKGVVVPQIDSALPEGIQVDILVRQADMTTESEAELDRWHKASDEAWEMIDRLEAEAA